MTFINIALHILGFLIIVALFLSPQAREKAAEFIESVFDAWRSF